MEDSKKGGIDVFRKLWQLVASPTNTRTLGLLVLLIIIATIPLTVFIAQKQQEIRQRAETSAGVGAGVGTCRDNPVNPPAANLKWKADCKDPNNAADSCFHDKGDGGTDNTLCPKNTWDPSNVNPDTSNWCYGFEGPFGDRRDFRCLQLVRIGCETRDAPGCAAPTPTPTPTGAVTPTPTPTPTGTPAAPKLYIDPNPVALGQKLTVIATGPSSCSLNITDPPVSGGGYSGCTNNGFNSCQGGNPKDSFPCWWKWSCTAGNVGSYTAKFDAGNPVNPACHAEKAYTVAQQNITPTPTPTPTPTGQPPGGTARLSFDLVLTGIGLGAGDNTNPRQKQRNLTVCLYTLDTNTAGDSNCSRGRKSGGVVSFNQATGHFVNQDFNLGGITSGQYQVFVKTNRYLRRRIPQIINIVTGQTTPVPQVTLIVGDSS